MSKNPFITSIDSKDSSISPPISKTQPHTIGTPPRRSTSATREKHTSPTSASKGHSTRPSQDLANHEKLVRKSSRARKQIPRDSIDNLDDILGSYHHEGPFDATLASRQIPGRAPVEATRIGNAMALAATPKEFVQRSLERHEPLDGISSHASGSVVDGKRLHYDEENVERQDGEYTDDNVHERDSGESQYRGARSRGDVGMVEMQGSSRGVVEYSEDVDQVDDLMAADKVVGASSSSESGLLGGLKKRLSVNRRK